jgi:hypothetical protein
MVTQNKMQTKKKTDFLFKSLEDLREATLGRVIRAVASVLFFNDENDDETKQDDDDTIMYFLERAFELYLEYGIPSKHCAYSWDEAILPYVRATFEEDHMHFESNMSRLVGSCYEAAFHSAVKNVPLDYSVQLINGEIAPSKIPPPLQEMRFRDHAVQYVTQIVNNEDICTLLQMYMQLQQKVWPNAKWEYMIADENGYMRAATDEEIEAALELKDSVRESLARLCVQKLYDHLERRRKGNKVFLSGVDLLLEDSWEADTSVADNRVLSIGELDFCLVAAVTLYDDLKYEAKCLRVRYEREFDIYTELMSNPDSKTYKHAELAQNETELRRIMDEKLQMITTRQRTNNNNNNNSNIINSNNNNNANDQQYGADLTEYLVAKNDLQKLSDDLRKFSVLAMEEMREYRARLDYKAQVDAKALLSHSEIANLLVKVVNMIVLGVAGTSDPNVTGANAPGALANAEAAYQYATDNMVHVNIRCQRKAQPNDTTRKKKEQMFRAKKIQGRKKSKEEAAQKVAALVLQANSPGGGKGQVRAECPNDSQYEENEDF